MSLVSLLLMVVVEVGKHVCGRKTTVDGQPASYSFAYSLCLVRSSSSESLDQKSWHSKA
jgi:hypothetical protein